MKDHILKLYDYNYWANGLILKNVEKLTGEQFIQGDAHSQGSVRDILVHIMFAEWIWRERMVGDSPDLSVVKLNLKPEDFSSTKELYDSWFDEELKMRDFLENITDEKFSGKFTYRSVRGEEFENGFLDVLTHVVLHGMQHRADVAEMLTELGHSPGNIDYIIYLRQEGKQP
jgi:uncharacterized damage-inducible protein DinB